MLEKLSSVLFGPTSENSTFLAPMVWRTEFHPKCTAPTVKHAAGSVMVWGCFTRRQVGKLCVLHRIMNKFYDRDILEQNLLPSIDHFKMGATIQALLFTVFKSHRELERRAKKHQPKNLEELEVQLTQEWNNNKLSVVEKLVDSVASRLYECVKMKSYLTKYELSFK